jgi:hypothetical protein
MEEELNEKSTTENSTEESIGESGSDSSSDSSSKPLLPASKGSKRDTEVGIWKAEKNDTWRAITAEYAPFASVKTDKMCFLFKDQGDAGGGVVRKIARPGLGRAQSGHEVARARTEAVM